MDDHVVFESVQRSGAPEGVTRPPILVFFFCGPLTHGFVTTANNGSSNMNTTTKQEKEDKKNTLKPTWFKLVCSFTAQKSETWVA